MGHGLRFRNVDLHIHTPASQCFIEPDVTPQDIVNQAMTVGLEAIAITDHNSAEWVDEVKEVAQGTGLTVFPGVEVTVQPGVHVLALFPEDRNSAHITDLLAELGLGADQRGNSEAMVTRYGIQEVIAIIRRHGALPVLAHIDDVKGAWRELKGQARIQLWQDAKFAAVEVIGESLPDEIGRPPYTYQPAYYWASDNPHPDQPTKHSHRGIGARSACFKLDDPITWEGLRQCFEDPQVRIRRGQPVLVHPMIEQVQIAGGFLDSMNVTLYPNLNCVIGGRGTGKSALLEIVRYAFDIPPKTDVNARQAQSLLERVFPAGARVTIRCRVGERTYRVERISGRAPQVFRSDDDEPLPVAPADLLPLQVYGQKEVYEISRDPQFQLSLLDNYVAEVLKPLNEEESRIVRDLRANADEILRLEDVIADSQEWLARLGVIQEEIRRMEELGFVARIRQKDQYEREKRLLNEAQAQVDVMLGALENFAQQQHLNPDVLADETLGDLPNQKVLRAQRALLEAIAKLVTQQSIVLRTAIAQKWAEGEEERAAWRAAYDEQEKAYQEVLREFADVGQIDPDRYIQLQQRKAELEARAREVEQYKVRVAGLMAQRKKRLGDLRDVRRQQYEERCKKAKELTDTLEGNVRITLWPEGHRSAYKDYLRELFAGLNVRNPHRDALAEVRAEHPERAAQQPVNVGGETRYLIPEIPRYLDPIDLAEAIRVEQTRTDESESLLETRFGVDSDAMRRNMVGLSRRQLFELELFTVLDLPMIELRVGGGELGYRPLEQLSVGQKCTALLSMVLLESPAPLLIDQPEDDLDNQFIFDQIVGTLRREKERRQFLIATHNANIPVSGDAELILVLQADEKHGQAAPDGIGSIDTEAIKEFVTRILEGGSVAFRIRKEKYGRLIEE